MLIRVINIIMFDRICGKNPEASFQASSFHIQCRCYTGMLIILVNSVPWTIYYHTKGCASDACTKGCDLMAVINVHIPRTHSSGQNSL